MPQMFLRGRRLACLILVGACSSVLSSAQPASSPSPTPPPSSAGESSAADIAWTQLNQSANSPRTIGGGQEKKLPEPDWDQVAVLARSFQTKYPDDSRVGAAAKLELLSLLRADRKKPGIAPATTKLAESYLADKTKPVRDRIEVRIAFEQIKLGQARHSSRPEILRARGSHARDLIAEFPDQPEGYGYLLSLTNGESLENARAMARELAASPGTPQKFREGARRVLAKLDLVGKPLALDPAAAAIAGANGKPIIVYSWSSKDAGFVGIIRRLAQDSTAVFIGLNVDANQQDAQSMAASLKLPGIQIYDGNGLEGAAARQLQLTMIPALYVTDAGGILRDVGGHMDIKGSLALVIAKKGGQP